MKHVLAALTVSAATAAYGQAFPSKPIRLVIENKPGGGGNIAMQEVARADPDGYTLIIGHIGTLAANPYMGSPLPYDANRIGPAKLPQPVVRRLADQAAKATRSRAVLERLEVESAIPVGSTPQQFAQFIAKEQVRWKEVILKAKIRGD